MLSDLTNKLATSSTPPTPQEAIIIPQSPWTSVAQKGTGDKGTNGRRGMLRQRKGRKGTAITVDGMAILRANAPNPKEPAQQQSKKPGRKMTGLKAPSLTSPQTKQDPHESTQP